MIDKSRQSLGNFKGIYSCCVGYLKTTIYLNGWYLKLQVITLIITCSFTLVLRLITGCWQNLLLCFAECMQNKWESLLNYFH